ncbi:hypothetical protein [Paenibacillus harenae]|uniref:hypothetical protein n=1 Tax=Paenibacillus harenae TaxID=306543 RepID=UPI00040063E0|nr:hypothetical protein [Paenibacillus harenae]
MNIKARYILLAILVAIATIIIFQLASKQVKSFHETAANEKIVQTKSFSINSVSTAWKTSAKGTVFVKGNEGRAEHIQIVAMIEIDPNDWGGVAFYIPDKWYISNIVSSYPENKIQSKPADYVATWTTPDTGADWKAWIEVGRDRSYRPTGGGTGTVVIDLVPDKNAKYQPETFEFGVEVGSNIKGGKKIMGTDSIRIPISINE